MRALHKALIKELKWVAEALPIIEGALDATVEREFDLVEELINKFMELRDKSESHYNLIDLLEDAKDNNEGHS